MLDQEAPVTAVPRKRISLALALVLGVGLLAVPAIASTESELEAKKQQLEEAQADLERINAAWQATEARLAEAQDRAAAARAEIALLEGELRRITESLNERAAAAYMSGGSMSVGALLTSDSLSDAADRLQYTMSVAEGDTDLANDVSVKTAQLRWQRQRYQEAVRVEADAARDLQGQAAAAEAKVSELNDLIADLRAELAREDEIAIGVTSAVAVTGSGAIQTCPVAPVAPGTARPAGSIGGLGVVVQHPNGDWTFYAHLGSTVSGSVSAGTPIGTIGSSGVSVTHLHFEYHPGGGPAVNPYSALLAVC